MQIYRERESFEIHSCWQDKHMSQGMLRGCCGVGVVGVAMMSLLPLSASLSCREPLGVDLRLHDLVLAGQHWRESFADGFGANGCYGEPRPCLLSARQAPLCFLKRDPSDHHDIIGELHPFLQEYLWKEISSDNMQAYLATQWPSLQQWGKVIYFTPHQHG